MRRWSAVVAMAVLTWQTVAAQTAPPAAGRAMPEGVDVSAQDRGASIGARVQGALKQLNYLHTAGGGCMWGIDACMIVGVAFILERAVRLRRRAILPGALLKKVGPLLERNDLDAVQEASRHYKRSTLGRVLLYLADNRDLPREERESGVNELASRSLDLHRMMCMPLTAICGISPLIGLLGTVVGIRECFRDVALSGEMGNPAMLAGGIEKALITTIYGLVVAIPVLAAYNLFRLRINLLANELEEAVSVIVSRNALSEKRDAK